MTLTLEIPDDLAARMESIPPELRNNFALTALAHSIDDLERREPGEPDREAVEDIRRAEEIGMDETVTISLEDFAKTLGVQL
jgi:hypothetical protein